MKDHRYIEENQIIDRYVMGKLSGEESEAFTEHFMNCAECIEQLELAEAFQRDLKIVAAEEAAAAVVRVGLLARLTSTRAIRGVAAFACAALLLLVLPFTYTTADPVQYDLGVVTRSGDEKALVITASPEETFILSRDLLLSDDQARFKITITDTSGSTALSLDGPVVNGRMEVILSGGSFEPGNYQCRLELAQDGANYEPYAQHALVIKR